MSERKTAGELQLKAAADPTKYDPIEIAYALCQDIIPQAYKCAHDSRHRWDEDEFFVVMIIAGDPLLKNIRRHKFYDYPYLPSPRPEQICFLYNKHTDQMKRLWSLPKAETMALLSEQTIVDKKWLQTKRWVDAFYNLKFWEHIRKEHGISHLSEHEYLEANRQKFIDAGSKESDTLISEPFDFSKIKVEHIANTKTARTE